MNVAAAQFFRRHGGNCFGGVLDDVGEALRNQTPVEMGRHRVFSNFGFKIDIGVTDTHQEHGLTDRIGHVLRRHYRRWHARKPRELVHHTPDIVDLPHDRAGALLEYRLVFGDDLPVLAAQTFSGKLDRRQRVLDLVRDAAGDVGPRGCTLRGDELGNVIQRNDVAMLRIWRLFGRDANRHRALASAAD